MVDTLNGEQLAADERARRTAELPPLLHLSTDEAKRVPSPGTQRALKAETGRSFDDMVGPDADGADRFQTLIWMKLRKTFPGLRWDDCADIDVQIDDSDAAVLSVDPTNGSVSVSSPGSAGSGD